MRQSLRASCQNHVISGVGINVSDDGRFKTVSVKRQTKCCDFITSTTLLAFTQQVSTVNLQTLAA